ncbi:MAG: hypothetical protein QW343_01185 [Candidatus Norongarragalinales archaeon]
MVRVNPRVKASLEKLYDAAGARKGSLPTLEGRRMTEREFEEKIDALTNDLVSWINEAKRKAFDEGVRAGFMQRSIASSGERAASAVAPETFSTQVVPPQTNIVIESPQTPSSHAFEHGASSVNNNGFTDKEEGLASKLARLTEKIDEVDATLASIRKMQLDLRKTQEEVKREFSAKLEEFSALNKEANEFADGMRSVASRITEVASRLSDALEENARIRNAPVLSLDSVNEKLSEICERLDSLSENAASKEIQKENSRLLESHGIELASIKSALKKQLKSVRRASKRITRVSRELEEVEGAVRKAGRKTARTVRRVAAELGAETKSVKRFARKAKSKAMQAAKAAEAVKAVKPAVKKFSKLARSVKNAKASKTKR